MHIGEPKCHSESDTTLVGALNIAGQPSPTRKGSVAKESRKRVTHTELAEIRLKLSERFCNGIPPTYDGQDKWPCEILFKQPLQRPME